MVGPGSPSLGPDSSRLLSEDKPKSQKKKSGGGWVGGVWAEALG